LTHIVSNEEKRFKTLMKAAASASKKKQEKRKKSNEKMKPLPGFNVIKLFF
jgi:hypothetical protein